jgi:hypothetical protein
MRSVARDRCGDIDGVVHDPSIKGKADRMRQTLKMIGLLLLGTLVLTLVQFALDL